MQGRRYRIILTHKMRRNHAFTAVAIIVAAMGIFSSIGHIYNPSDKTTELAINSAGAASLARGAIQSDSSSSIPHTVLGQDCLSENGLPDSNCTNGAVDLNCTLDDVKKAGYSATVRPTTAITNPMKKTVAQEYGMGKTASSLVEGDHLIEISVCGCPGPNYAYKTVSGKYYTPHCVSLSGQETTGDPFYLNFWPESWTGQNNAHDKDKVEARVLKEVRDGTLSLLGAESCLAQNWQTCP